MGVGDLDSLEGVGWRLEEGSHPLPPGPGHVPNEAAAIFSGIENKSPTSRRYIFHVNGVQYRA